MSTLRTVAVRIEGGGQLVIVEPTWCEGHENTVMYPTDVAHGSAEQLVTVTTGRGDVELLAVALEHAPYSITGSRTPYGVVRIGGDYHRFDVAGLRALAEQIADRAPAALRALAEQLETVLEDGGEQR